MTETTVVSAVEKIAGDLKQELHGAIEQVQKSYDNLEKKYDGLDVAVVKNLEEKTADMIEQIGAVKAQNEAIQKQQELLEKIACRLGKSNDQTKTEFEDYKKGLNMYMRTGAPIEQSVVDGVIKSVAADVAKYGADNEIDSVFKKLQTNVNPRGGYFALPDRLAQEVTRDFETTPMRSQANVITTGDGSVELIINDNEFASGGWVGETQSRSETDTADIGKLTIQVHEQFAQPIVTQRMLDTASINVPQWVATQTNAILGRTENSAYVSGDGNEKPKGFLSYPAWAVEDVYQRGALEQILSGTDSAPTSDSLIKTQNQLKQMYQSGAVWMMKRRVWTQVLQLKDSENRYLINSMILKEGTDAVLLGAPVIFADDMQDPGVDSLSIAYGNFRVGYTIVDGIGVRVIRDDVTSKPNVKFYTTKQTGGAVTNYEAIKILKFGS